MLLPSEYYLHQGWKGSRLLLQLYRYRLINSPREKKVKGKTTSIKQEIENDRETWLERVNIHLEKLFDKANKEKKMLRHMACHYLTWNKICNSRVKRLKAKLRRALRSKKEHDKLKILVEASLYQQGT